MSETKKYQIELRYDQNAADEEISALADSLRKRGHHVDIRRCGRSGFVDDLARSGVDLKEIAENVRGAAENGMQKIRDIVSPFVKNNGTADNKQNTSQNDRKENDKKDDAAAAGGFDEIGPEAHADPADSASVNKALVVTSPECLDDAPWDAIRIGMIPKTILDRAWQPGTLDAVIVPHHAFRPYFDSIRWEPERVFDGGYLACIDDIPSLTHEDAMKRFNLNTDDGPVVLVMASGFPENTMHTLMVQMSLLQKPVQIFFYHAGDNALAGALRTLAQRFGVKARMFGKVDRLSDYLAIADLAVVRAGDVNIGLLENAGVPMIAVPAHEPSPLVNFLAHEKAMAITPQLHQLASMTNPFLVNPSAMTAMRTAAASIASFGSIELCADAIEAVLGSADTILPDPQKRAPVSNGFEEIGNSGDFAFNNAFMPPVAAPAPVQSVATPIPVQQQGTPLQPIVAVDPMMPMLTPTIAPANPAPADQPILAPVLNAKSKEEIQEEYTRLILSEKSIDKSLDMAGAEVQQWELRLDLARRNQRDDLINSAIIRLNAAKTEEVALMRQKEEINNQKAALKQAARSTPQTTVSPFSISIDSELFATEKDPLEAEFTKLQNDEALRRLHEKLGK